VALQDINDAADRIGGKWITAPRTKGESIQGELVDAEYRQMTFEGAPVMKRGTSTPREELVLTLRVDQRDGADDNGLRRVGLKERAASAVLKAIKDSGQKAAAGGMIWLACSADKADDRSQPEYTASYKPPTLSVLDQATAGAPEAPW
jgi:hypothetical protein